MHRKTQKYYDMLYAAQGKDYEAECADIAAYIAQHHPKAKTILDVGCGTGTHARILRDQFNFVVDGIDIDPDMIAEAKKKIPEGDFHVADMADFDLGKKYDVVISMFSAIGYLKHGDKVTDALRCFKNHVRDDGLVMVEPWLTPDIFNGGKTHIDTAAQDDIKLSRLSLTEVEGHISRIFFRWTVATPEKIETLDETLELGLFSIEEMLRFFKDAGLEAQYDEAQGKFSKRGIYLARLG